MDVNEEDFDARLRSRLSELDHAYPAALPDKDAVWEGLESRLPGSRNAGRWRYPLAVAASVALLLVASMWWFTPRTGEEVTITYRTEKVADPEPDGAERNGLPESHGIAFIEEQCRRQHPVCNSTAFLELKRELDQLTRQAEQVNRRLETFGPDPALVKAETRLENHKSYLIRELIQILKS
ncbi:MAG: hypothetical protein ICV83_21620 [Cytophagales bacterium]|nr:hypothetical protein [Cytophagales bacterium]